MIERPATGFRPADLALLVFPLLLAVCFLKAVSHLHHTWIGAVLWTVGAVASFCFSIHVSFHEFAHRRSVHGGLGNLVFDFAATLFMGLSFTAFRWHHINHHRYQNRLEDYSSTWRASPSGPVPRPVLAYMFGWPAQVLRAKLKMDQEERDTLLPNKMAARMEAERNVLLGAFCALVAMDWRAALLYAVCLYLGWSFAFLKNYRQHPPIRYGADPIGSNHSSLYNTVFLNNGLHARHHLSSDLPWFQLEGE